MKNKEKLHFNYNQMAPCVYRIQCSQLHMASPIFPMVQLTIGLVKTCVIQDRLTVIVLDESHIFHDLFRLVL